MVEMLPNLYLRELVYHLIKRNSLPILFIFFSFAVSAQNLSVQGLAKEFIGKTISISTYGDYITGTLNEIVSIVIDKDGSFKLAANIETVSEAVLRVGGYEGTIMVEPGKSYNLILEQYKNGGANLAISIENSKKGELNFDINAFETGFSELTASYYDLITKALELRESFS